jgi:hypothetical protein
MSLALQLVFPGNSQIRPKLEQASLGRYSSSYTCKFPIGSNPGKIEVVISFEGSELAKF